MNLQPNSSARFAQTTLTVACLVILVLYGLMIDLKGISTDEGIRLAIINGGQTFTQGMPVISPTWAMVLKAGNPYAYQPLYYLMQNTLMRAAQTHDVIFFRLVNLFFLWVALQGLLSLSKTWRLVPRLFLLGIFAFNAYLFMHVLQIREYIVGVAFYIWSTWLVLRLIARPLERSWSDVAWFVAYGILLTLGFFVQSWVAFPAFGQFLFLVARRADQRPRFYVHLALSYAIVLSAVWLYLPSHQQRVDVGRWGGSGTELWPQLSMGFHLVLSGHLPGEYRFTDFLFWFWLAVIAGGGLLLLGKKFRAATGTKYTEFKSQFLLMFLCSVISLAFQIGYFVKMDSNLPVWPRYFVIHYFFLTWLAAATFNYLYEFRSSSSGSRWLRRSLTAGIAVIAAVALASGVFQTISYYKNPLLDTGLSRESNWFTTTSELARIIEPNDLLVTYDFICRTNLTFTRPIPNRVILLPEIETTDLKSVPRVVYLESISVLSQRGDLVARMSAVGFKTMREFRIHAADGNSLVTDWRFLAFTR